jgi:UDP:flavonoid glycosyltransferase YjiC (YdhE family)
MVVLPLFWDQYDNAQRLDETGYGIRLDTYAHRPERLPGAINELLADQRLAERSVKVSEWLRVHGTGWPPT